MCTQMGHYLAYKMTKYEPTFHIFDQFVKTCFVIYLYINMTY